MQGQRSAVIDAGSRQLRRVARQALAAGGIVVFPTETFYGLAVRAADAAAVQRLASFKQRPAAKPLPLIAASRVGCAAWVEIPRLLEPLCERFWPGPLTVVARAKGSGWPAALLGGGETVAIRVSSHPTARLLAEVAGGCITSTSANSAGAAPARCLAELEPLVREQSDLLVEGGVLAGGLASTIVGVAGDRVVILRPGAIAASAIATTVAATVDLAVGAA